jgi:hypothetical protein
MAETQPRTSSNDAGNATGSSSKAQPARGVSAVPAVNLKINQADLFNDLDALIGAGRVQQGCSVGLMVSKLDEPLRNKLNEIFCNTKVDSSSLKTLMDSYGLAVSSSDVLRRHRRRLIGKDGCKCPIENSAVSPK